MQEGGNDAGKAREENAQRGSASAAGLPSPEDPWLQPHKVELPDPIEGYVRRPEVEERCALTDRRLTVLHAPGGFGKTALLADRCRALRERGIPVAWLSLDEDDGPTSVATYLALAFERAGVAAFDVRVGRSQSRETDAADGEADSQADYRIGLLIRALERRRTPCVLAMDELDRLRSPEAVATINALRHRQCTRAPRAGGRDERASVFRARALGILPPAEDASEADP